MAIREMCWSPRFKVEFPSEFENVNNEHDKQFQPFLEEAACSCLENFK